MNPNRIAPNSEIERYKRTTLLLAIPHTAIRAVTVVAGPTLKKSGQRPHSYQGTKVHRPKAMLGYPPQYGNDY